MENINTLLTAVMAGLLFWYSKKDNNKVVSMCWLLVCILKIIEFISNLIML